jgi:hypothetical protein
MTSVYHRSLTSTNSIVESWGWVVLIGEFLAQISARKRIILTAVTSYHSVQENVEVPKYPWLDHGLSSRFLSCSVFPAVCTETSCCLTMFLVTSFGPLNLRNSTELWRATHNAFVKCDACIRGKGKYFKHFIFNCGESTHHINCSILN